MPLQPIGAASDPRGFDPVYGRGGEVSGFPSPYIVGDVTVHPSAAIAPGAILQAAPGSRIAIAPGVCLGVGVILNACGGAIAIERNATLGAGVLIVGTCTIGEGACIGTATTVFYADVAAMQSIPAGSLVGDTSRQVALDETPPVATAGNSPTDTPTNTSQATADAATPPTSESQALATKPSNAVIYGRTYVSQLLVTLFPHKEKPS